MPARTSHVVRAAQLHRLSAPVLAAALLSPILGCGPSDSPGRPVVQAGSDRVVQSALPPALTDIEGALHRPFEDSDAIANVLVFTLQDCPIANSYVPTLNQIVDDYGARGIRLLLVHVDPQLTIE
ncbi:MAG TPA: hypothetical protein VHK01_08320, partial [Lacipirellulaceae bacterium]|nr:hypothetical protein [Lacipirellulaceae bacterium]